MYYFVLVNLLVRQNISERLIGVGRGQYGLAAAPGLRKPCDRAC